MKRQTLGFSLIELMLVVAIIAILSTVAVPFYMRQKARNVQAAVVPCISEVALQLENYRQNHGVYPPDDPWDAISATRECGEHYYGHIEVQDNGTRYVIAFKDSLKEVWSGGGEDIIASTNISSDIHYVKNSVKGTTSSLPKDGDYTYTLPAF